MAYTRYAWVANRIEREDMKRLYYLKQETRKPITRLVAEAVKTAQDEYCEHPPCVITGFVMCINGAAALVSWLKKEDNEGLIEKGKSR